MLSGETALLPKNSVLLSNKNQTFPLPRDVRLSSTSVVAVLGRMVSVAMSTPVQKLAFRTKLAFPSPVKVEADVVVTKGQCSLRCWRSLRGAPMVLKISTVLPVGARKLVLTSLATKISLPPAVLV